MAKQNDQPDEKSSLRRQAREIADSLAIAFILAMVIRHYVLEVFKIPTKSMQPTLLGDPWTGDKILVNKFAYDFRDPDRWDVIVFKFPDDISRNYIKRVIGLPGETVRIRDGDVYIDGAIIRKPWRIQEALWRRRLDSGKAASWSGGSPEFWDLADGELRCDCKDELHPQYIRYKGPYEGDILAYEERHFRESRRPFVPMPTSDIMLQFYLVPQKLAGTLFVAFDIQTASSVPDSIDQWTIRLPVGRETEGEGRARVDADRAADGKLRPQAWREGQLVDTGEPYTLAVGRPVLVQVCNVDMTIIVRIGDREVLRAPYKLERGIASWPGLRRKIEIEVGCKQGHVVLRKPGIYADVYYTENPDLRAVRQPFTLADDEFFVLGDNSCNSRDSRGWESRGGVPRDYLVGEAFLVLWPLGRMKLVR